MYSIDFSDFMNIAKNLGYVLINCCILNCETGDIINVLPDLVIKFITDSDEFEYETNYWLHTEFCRENIWIGSKYFASFLLKNKYN